MRIKVGNDYLDYDGSITVDRQAFTFEDISAYQGDRSYQFNLPKTTNNISILGLQTIDLLTKTIYNRVECELFDDLNSCYRGFLIVERITGTIDVAFVTGNYEWINEINSFIKDIPYMSDYDTDINETTITDSFDGSTNILFPLVDRGTLSTRGYRNLFYDDFHPFIRVRDVMKEIFKWHQFKFTGELLNDPLYNKLIVSSSVFGADREDAAKRECFVGISSTQEITGSAEVDAVDNTGSFFDSTNGNWNNADSAFVSDGEMFIKVEIHAVIASLANVDDWSVAIFKDSEQHFNFGKTSSDLEIDFYAYIRVTTGTEIEFVVLLGGSSGTPSCDLTQFTARFSVVKFYRAYGKSLLGKTRSIDFISNIFKIFSVVPEFDVVSKTLTANLFKNIHTKPEVDISEYFSNQTIDFREFIKRYGKRSWLKYSPSISQSAGEYNEKNPAEYGSDYIEVDNDFLGNDVDAISIIFTAPRTKYIDVLAGYFPVLTYAELEDGNSFNKDDADTLLDPFGPGALVRAEGKDPRINGLDWASTSLLGGVDLQNAPSNDFETVSEQIIRDADSGELTLLVFEPSVAFADVSEHVAINIIDHGGALSYSGYASIGYAYFVKPETNAATNFPQTPAFGLPNEFTQYQLTAKDVYYKDVQNVLNDPVKVKAVMYLPYSVFLSLSSHVPYRLHTKDFNALFYLNKVSGYRGSQYPCILELIKL